MDRVYQLSLFMQQLGGTECEHLSTPSQFELKFTEELSADPPKTQGRREQCIQKLVEYFDTHNQPASERIEIFSQYAKENMLETVNMVDPIYPEMRHAGESIRSQLEKGGVASLPELQRARNEQCEVLTRAGSDAAAEMVLNGRKEVCKGFKVVAMFNTVLKIINGEHKVTKLDSDEAIIELNQEVTFQKDVMPGLSDRAYQPFMRHSHVRILFEPHTALIKHVFWHYNRNKVITEELGYQKSGSDESFLTGR